MVVPSTTMLIGSLQENLYISWSYISILILLRTVWLTDIVCLMPEPDHRVCDEPNLPVCLWQLIAISELEKREGTCQHFSGKTGSYELFSLQQSTTMCHRALGCLGEQTRSRGLHGTSHSCREWNQLASKWYQAQAQCLRKAALDTSDENAELELTMTWACEPCENVFAPVGAAMLGGCSATHPPFRCI